MHLLPATEVKVCTETSQEKLLTSIKGSWSLFKVKLCTSNVYGSSLSDPNAGILLCLIDRNGDSILHRIPAISESNSANLMDMVESDTLHFQRGSVDEFTFEGPKMGRIESLWVSVESGKSEMVVKSLRICSLECLFYSMTQNWEQYTMNAQPRLLPTLYLIYACQLS